MTTEKWLEIVDELGPRFAVGAAERDATDSFVADHYPAMKAAGLTAALVPEDLGGGGATYSDMAAILRRLGYQKFHAPTSRCTSTRRASINHETARRHSSPVAPSN